MSELYRLQPPELERLLHSPTFHQALDAILAFADVKQQQAGFAVFGAAGTLGLSPIVEHHPLQSVTHRIQHTVRPELVATVHAHPPGPGAQLPTRQDMIDHCELDRHVPGFVSIVAGRPGPGSPASLMLARAEPNYIGSLGSWYAANRLTPGERDPIKLLSAMDQTKLRYGEMLYSPKTPRFEYYPAPEVFIPQLFGVGRTTATEPGS